jgi:hypothetical protein
MRVGLLLQNCMAEEFNVINMEKYRLQFEEFKSLDSQRTALLDVRPSFSFQASCLLEPGATRGPCPYPIPVESSAVRLGCGERCSKGFARKAEIC